MKIILYRNVYSVVMLVMLITILTACSSTRLIYTFVDKFIKNEIIYFIDLDKDEEKVMSYEVSKMLIWHRTFMLPKYANFLSDMANKLEADQYDVVYISKSLENGWSLIEETIIGLTPYASEFLIRHQTASDIEFMEKRMKIRQQERLIKLSEPNDIRYENNLDRLTSNFERFFGNLTDEQLLLLEEYSTATLEDSKTRLYNRTLRQKALVKFLKTQPTQDELMTFLNKLLLYGHLITNPANKAFSEAWLERFQALLANMLATSSLEQRKKIIAKLRNYSIDFKNISL